MWQKCWNTNQSLVHNLRFRERGPLKSWRPETMAEAIFSVLKEGLSLSQAARKYDIPYPTFVLYANRVHNMLGPSADGGAGQSTTQSDFGPWPTVTSCSDNQPLMTNEQWESRVIELQKVSVVYPFFSLGSYIMLRVCFVLFLGNRLFDADVLKSKYRYKLLLT